MGLNHGAIAKEMRKEASKGLAQALKKSEIGGKTYFTGPSLKVLLSLRPSEVLELRHIETKHLNELEVLLERHGLALQTEADDDDQDGVGREELLARMRAECEEQLNIIEARRKALVEGGFDPQLAAATSTLAKTIAQLNTEARQQEKHQARVVETLTEEQEIAACVDYLENTTSKARREILRVLQELEGERKLLGHS